MAQLKSTNITGNLAVTGNVVANKLIKLGGTSDQILMADGTTSSKSEILGKINAAVTIKGTLGSGGTITALPTASSSILGDGYKVITAGTYNSVSAKIGDMFICYQVSSSSYAWMHIPSGDDIEDTWRPIQLNGNQILSNGNTSNALNFKPGSNIGITNSSGTLTFTATDTGATAITTSGSGNAVTEASYNASNRTITLTKGSTFALASDILTYTFTGGEDSFKVTPSGGSAQTVNVTNRLIQSPDTRSTSYVPKDVSTGVVFDFKSTTAVTSSGESFGASGDYLGVMTWRSYGSATDLTGGPVFQLGYDMSGNLWRRTSNSATGWNNWVRLTTTSDTPTVNNGKLTIQKNGTEVATFTANQSGNTTANISVPTKVSELTNDNGFVTGPGSATDNAIARFNSTTGKLIQNSNVTIDDNGNITLPNNATLKLNTYGTRFLTLSGNNIVADMSNDGGTWAGSFAEVKDPSGTTTTMLGWLGGSTLTHIYMGGAYNDPYMKMTAAGLFTFKNQVTINAAQGTAPLKVTSTTVNTNLNADLLDGKHASEFAVAGDYLPKTTYEWNKEFAAGSNGAISLGRYNVYDSQLTFDITSTTGQSISGKLVIATQNGVLLQAKVFGDASGLLVSKLIIYQSAITGSRSWIEVFCNFDGWSKNKVHMYGVALNSATVEKQMNSVTISNGVPSGVTSGDTKWAGTIINDITTYCAAIGHSHDVNIAVSTGTNELTLAHGTKYALTAGGQSFIFTTPADNSKTYGADRGISLVSGKFGHSNTAITAQSTKGLYKISYDAYGHITGTESFTLPTVNNGTLTIQRNGTTVTTFSANQSGNTTANISVPTKVSDLTNDSGFITSSSLPTVNNGTLTMNTSGTGLSGSASFTANQSGNSTFTVALNSSSAGNRSANQVVLAAATGQINSTKYTITNGATAKATWQYNSTTDCVELVW